MMSNYAARALLLLCCAGLIATQTRAQISFGAQAPVEVSARDSNGQPNKTPEKFALELYKSVTKKLDKENVLLAPLSVWSLLALLVEGADGDTLQQLQNILGIRSDATSIRQTYRSIQHLYTPAVELSMSQFLFANKNYSILSSYENTVRTFYRTKVESFDVDTKNKRHETYDYINNHVRNATHGQIEKAVHASDLRDAQLLLISAMYFRADWMQPFNRSLTKEEVFYDENEKEIGKVNMMTVSAPFPYEFVPSIDAYCLELPYGQDNETSMIIFLPRKGVQLQTMIERIAEIKLQTVYDAMKEAADRLEDDEVQVSLPRFTFTSSYNLNGILIDMGLKDIFGPAANLSKISGNPLYLSRINHISRIQVNEEGTVASAVTTAGLANKIIAQPFVGNRPFAFLIANKRTNLVLFMGQYKNPSLV